MTRQRLALLLITLPGWLAATPAAAHDEMVSSSEVDVGDHQVVWRIDVGIAGLAKALHLAAGEGELDEAGLRAAAPEAGRYLASALEVRADGARLTAVIGALEPRYETALPGGKPVLVRAIQTLVFPTARPFAQLTARVAFFAELTSQHRSMVRVHAGASIRHFVRLGPTSITVGVQDLAPSPWATVGEFLRWGAHHIFVGYDHIAFLLALLLAVTRLRELLKIVTSFTVAHSLTLLLAALGLVRIPSRVSEVLIAASIVYVAVENLRSAGRELRHRWLLTFAFGLVHGLGFATELQRRLAELQGHVLLPVLSFNLGVELGQVVIVALLFPLLARLRAGPTPQARLLHERRIMRLGSVPILLLGLVWMVGRILG
jgi:hydrogenase/urease accessory protein HupE